MEIKKQKITTENTEKLIVIKKEKNTENTEKNKKNKKEIATDEHR